jgi:hypothetical protein
VGPLVVAEGTNGGGGRFVNIWTPSTFAQAGMLVSDTSTEGRVYEMSSEHHVRNEIVLRNVSNWNIYSLQTEEERGEGGFALPLDIENSSNITVANFHIYRVVSMFQPFPFAIRIAASKDIRLRNIHCYSDSKVSFDSAAYDQTSNVEVRQREFAWLTVSGNQPRTREKRASQMLDSGAKVERLVGGFYNISGGAADPAGNYYFVDARWQRIYRWDAGARRLSTVADNPLDPVQLVFDKAGNLMVISYAGQGTVYSFRPASKLVRPGSVRIASNNLDSLPNVAFQTPDKKVVVIVVNAAQTAQTFHIRYRGKLITPVLAPGAVGTYIW